MDVGAIGGGIAAGGSSGLPGGAASPGAGLVGQVAAGGAPAPTTVQEALAGSLTTVDQLADLLEGFTSADILFALILLAALRPDDDGKRSGLSAAFGVLAGAAMATSIAQSLGSQLDGPVTEVGSGEGLGGNLNVTA